MKRTLLYLCLVSALLLIGACETAQEPEEATTVEAINPFVGTWVLNVSESEFNPPESAPQSGVVVIDEQENGLKFTFDEVDAEGNAIHAEEAPKFDGEGYPVSGRDTIDTVMLRKISDFSFEARDMKDGTEVDRALIVISDDGNTSTATITSKDENGEELISTYIYDKQ